ncbi:MAG: hypothetical protein K2P48_00280 [Lachnospiraceae bacterium]|nr:hypothetical protein [Lachnospiraceae bacterium]
MKHRITKNWGLKLVSFLFAVMLWIIVTNINDPSSPLKVNNIPVIIKNENLITDRGQVFEVLDGTDMIDSVTIWAPRSIIDTLQASNVVAEADMNDLTSLNTISIKLYTNKYNDKLDSIKGSIESVKLNIEDKQARSFPIRPNVTGDIQEGYMVGNVSTEQNLIRVSGPQSVVSQIAKAQAEVDVSGFTSNIGTDSDIRLYNEEGVEIRSESIEKNITKVRVNVEILEKKTVPIVYKVSGVPADGFKANGEITSSRNSIMIAGKSKLMRETNSIEIPEEVLDVSGARETVQTTIDINNYLPEGAILAEEDFNGQITIAAGVEPVQRQNISVPVESVNITGVPIGFHAAITEPEENYDIVLIGLSSELEQIDTAAIEAYVDMAAWMAAEERTEVEDGYYRMPLSVRLPEDSTVTLEENWINVHVTEQDGT